MSQVFISYASEDADFARRLATAFEGLGWSVWWDKQIPPGMDYAHVIEHAVNAARCVVVLWSRHSVASRWVHTEAAAAADRNIAATVIIDDIQFDEIPFEFKRLQAVNLRDWQPGRQHAAFDLLVGRIGAALQQPGVPDRAPRAEVHAQGPASWGDALTDWGTGRQRGFRIGGVAAAIAGIAGLGLAPNPVDPLVLGLNIAAFGLAALLFHMGRRPA